MFKGLKRVKMPHHRAFVGLKPLMPSHLETEIVAVHFIEYTRRDTTLTLLKLLQIAFRLY